MRKYFHVTASPERVLKDGIKPGQPACVRELYGLSRWYYNANFDDNDQLGILVLDAMVHALGRCLESESVYLTTDPTYAKMNCGASSEMTDSLKQRFSHLFPKGKRMTIAKFESRKDYEPLTRSLETHFAKNPCYLCEIELDSDDLKDLKANLPPRSLDVEREKETILTHVPPEKIKKCEPIAPKEVVSYVRRLIIYGPD